MSDQNDNITTPKLCLNMIVKNESRVILRMLRSVIRIIDSYCICDTGSTDNTVALISDFFQSQVPPIPGKIVSEPFRDFAYNRTFALNACVDMPSADYILLMDADMVLDFPANFDTNEFKQQLTKADAFHFFQGSHTFYYKNTRIVRNRIGIKYWGVTHEYVDMPEGTHMISIPKSNIFIVDIGDGGSKSDKFERDIRLLTQGLIDNPNNNRYTFYLANTYKDNHKFEEAIDYYNKRIHLGGWFEEVWFSYYAIGLCHKHLGNMTQAIHSWMEAYQYFPYRLENLNEIIEHYRYLGKNHLSYMFCDKALSHLRNLHSIDYLFLNPDVYDYKLLYEMSIIGYYTNPDNYDLAGISMCVLNYQYLNENTIRNTLMNYKFYSKQLIDISSHNDPGLLKEELNTVGLNCNIDTSEFVGSTPSIIHINPNEIAVCRRFVNYRINSQGGYDNKETINTINVFAKFNRNTQTNLWKKTDEYIVNYNRNYDGKYVGMEDVRLMYKSGSILFNANRGIGFHTTMMIEHGELRMDTQCVTSGFITIDKQKAIEKNWVLFEDTRGELKSVYQWYPMRIGTVTEDVSVDIEDDISEHEKLKTYTFNVTHNVNTPALFKHVRGSTNGIRIGNEVWFMCHLVSYEDRRYYYHLFVVLNADTMELLRYTRLFTFAKEKVEYTLGFIYFEETDLFLIGYSRMDSDTRYMYVSKSSIENWMHSDIEMKRRGWK